MSEIAIKRKVSDMVAEYSHKLENIPAALKEFEAAGDALKMAATIGGTYGQGQIDVGSNYERNLSENLRRSAWLHLYSALNIRTIASAKDQSRFDQDMASPPEFTMDNIRATFGDYILDPWGNILRGLAETFCDLDQSYKSHERVKIGVAGLPKRIIVSGFGGFSSWGEKRIEDVINALAAYQGKPLVSHTELKALLKDGNALRGECDLLHYDHKTHKEEKKAFPGRGITLKLFKNGNGHLFFEPETLKDINRALAEYYGDVLADGYEKKPDQKRPSTEIAKDLQYYKTPERSVEYAFYDTAIYDGEKILEPSCGCGMLMDGILAQNSAADILGIEVHAERASEARAKGHKVLTANFLECEPNPIYDKVIMNPPFYGRHYEKHIRHALKFLKDDGELISILPASARYDHKLFKGRWRDMPVGSFRESGTNISTTVLKLFKKDFS